MLSPEPFLIFTRKFNELGLRHMVSGLGDAWSRAELKVMIERERLQPEWAQALAFDS